ncbi:unnamed protein product [Gongylonema pulchrum]|uniref:WD_REPEATS_REGION domain-containing protein n=1 Tax=Gongylonema pulchrum TaxID=637853 RepID=A0A183EH37_9BILA|nr:unnamed protein product [Gongylonema pulchrum]
MNVIHWSSDNVIAVALTYALYLWNASTGEITFYKTKVCMYVYMCVYVCMYVCIYVCMYVYVYVCIYVCIYIYV